jgi:hypothetical protein
VPRVAPRPGKGGEQHKYLQDLIERWGKLRGYRATIEKQILAGAGSVDVALEREGFSLACEISVTTSAEHEAGNVQKCLAAGFDQVAVVSPDKKGLQKAREAILRNLEESCRERVLFFTPEEFISFLDEQQLPAGGEQTVGGYRVRSNYRPVSDSERKSRTRAISEVILKRLRQFKPDR